LLASIGWRLRRQIAAPLEPRDHLARIGVARDIEQRVFDGWRGVLPQPCLA